MARGKLTSEEIKFLKANPFVVNADETRIIYTNAFKEHFMKEYNLGKGPTQIFKEAGFDTAILGSKRIERATARWKESYLSGTLAKRKPISFKGKQAISELKITKKLIRKDKNKIYNLNNKVTKLEKKLSKVQSSKLNIVNKLESQLDKKHYSNIRKLKKLSEDKDLKISRQQAKINDLQAQVEMLKKVGILGRRRCEKKAFGKIDLYEIIEKTIDAYNLKGQVKTLCSLLGVSRSSYYYYLNSKLTRQEKEDCDLQKFFFIQKAYNQNDYYKKGSRSIHMTLRHDLDIVINRKCIQRLMHKFNLKCPLKTTNPYKNIWKATKEDKIAPNLLKRAFKPGKLRKVFLTDITYIKHQGEFSYLSVILDSQSNEPLAYKLSKNLKMDFVMDTLKQLDTSSFAKDVLLHSDQGVHYSSKIFREELKKLGITQSMSRRGNCLDNAPMESFFGHMKREAHFDSNCSFEELEIAIENYINYYKYDRRQETLKQMTPFEYSHTLLNAA